MKEDFQILEEFIETCDELRRQKGIVPDRSYESSRKKLQDEVAGYAEAVRQGQLTSRARWRTSKKLFQRAVQLQAVLW